MDKEINLFKSGVLVDLNIHKWTAQVKLEPRDLGLKEEDLSTLLKLGTKYLIPKEYIAPFVNIDAAARRILSAYSIKFPIGDSAFVPITNFDNLMHDLELVKKDFELYKKQFIEKYEELKKQALKQYEEYSYVLKERNNWTEEQRIEFINNIKAHYKTKEELEQKIRFEIVVYKINLDVELESENVKNIRKMVTERINEFVRSINQHVINEIKELYNDLLNRKRRRINENIYQIIEKKLKSLKNLNITNNQQVNDFIDNTLSEIKSWINKDIDEIKDEIKKALLKTDKLKIEEPRMKILL